jgi:hypothetical protein
MRGSPNTAYDVTRFHSPDSTTQENVPFSAGQHTCPAVHSAPHSGDGCGDGDIEVDADTDVDVDVDMDGDVDVVVVVVVDVKEVAVLDVSASGAAKRAGDCPATMPARRSVVANSSTATDGRQANRVLSYLDKIPQKRLSVALHPFLLSFTPAKHPKNVQVCACACACACA